MSDIDWAAMFVPSGSLLEIFIRGTVVYLALFIGLRLMPRRALGKFGVGDLLAIVLLADAVQNGMAGEYRSVTEALVLAGTILGWALLTDLIDYRFPKLNLVEGERVELVRDGRLLTRNLERQRISEEELMAELRQVGQETLANVRHAYLEGNGQLSVILDVPDRQPLRPRR